VGNQFWSNYHSLQIICVDKKVQSVRLSTGLYLKRIGGLAAPSEGRSSCSQTSTSQSMSLFWYGGVLKDQNQYTEIKGNASMIL